MKQHEVLDDKLWWLIPRKTAIGIDIGSRQSKAVLLHDGQLHTALIPTGFFMSETAEELISLVLNQAGLSRKDIDFIVATGYGRIALRFEDIPHRLVTEISCHGMGAHYLNRQVRTIIDIGGQDAKAIRIDPETGNVEEFAMNDKCAAGTGRFLEKIAEVLGYDVTKIGEVALDSLEPIPISSQCVVFAESEVISGRAKGDNVKDLAAGINISVAKRVNSLLNRVGIEDEILFTGGVSNNVGMRKAIETILKCHLVAPKLDSVFAGALGAAIFAASYSAKAEEFDKESQNELVSVSADIEDAIAANTENFLNHRTGKKKNIGYLCQYTPVEILSAANVSFMRIMNAGTQKEIVAGEAYTQSVFCDITKSIIGGFETGNPLYMAIDGVCTFYACECMRKTAEVLNERFFPTEIYNLPRKRTSPHSRAYLRNEVEAFKENLERNTGEKIDEATIRQNIILYNKARGYLKEISAFRKSDNPILTGGQYKKIISGFFSLPIEELLKQLEQILGKLKDAKPNSGRKIRLMLSGGMVADGDDKVVKIIEEELGARIVAEDNCTGLKPIYHPIPENDDDVYTNLANGYADLPPCFRMKPVEDSIKFSVNLANDYAVDGVVFYFLKFCPCSSIMVRDYIDTFQKLGIPILILTGDYASGDEGQLRTRLEAFVEMLKEGGK
jgi:predicted CoA-substrate-specific enzyme activase